MVKNVQQALELRSVILLSKSFERQSGDGNSIQTVLVQIRVVTLSWQHRGRSSAHQLDRVAVYREPKGNSVQGRTVVLVISMATDPALLPQTGRSEGRMIGGELYANVENGLWPR